MDGLDPKKLCAYMNIKYLITTLGKHGEVQRGN